MPQPLSTDEMLAHRRAISPVDGCAGLHRAEEGCRVALLDPGLAQTARAWSARTSAWSQSLRAIASSACSHRPVEFGYRVQVADNDDGIVLDYSVEYSAAPDAPQLAPAVERIGRCTGRVPRAVTADPLLRRARGGARPASPWRAHRRDPQSQDLTRAESGRASAQLPSAGQMAHRLGGGISYLKRGYGWDGTRLDGRQRASILCGHGFFAHNLVKIGALASQLARRPRHPRHRPSSKLRAKAFRSK